MEERFSKAKKQIYDYYFSPSFSGKFDDKTGDFHLLVDGFPIDHLVNKKEKVAKEIIKEQKGRISVILEKEDEEYNEKKKLLSFSFSLSFLYETVIEVGKRKGKEKREIRDSITVNPSAIDSDYDSDFLDIDLLDEFDEEEGIFQELKEKVCTSRHEYKKKIKKIEKL